MSKSNTFEASLLGLIFQNANIANIGDATGLRGSSAAGNLYLALCTADPGEAGSAITNEAAYTGYARQARARASGTGGFTLTGSIITLADDVSFGECTASPGSPITYFAVVNTASGAGIILYSGAVSPTITMALGVTPRLKSGTSVTED